MHPTILHPPVVTGQALTDLKAWMAISRSNEDALLTNLLQASLQTCEKMVGETPLAKTVEELFNAKSGWQSLSSLPVRSLQQVETVASNGDRMLIPTGDINFEIGPDGSARFQFLGPISAQRISVQIQVGIATEWANMPPGLKQGVIRLASFYFRERDQNNTRALPIPESIATLWKPWRKLRVS